MCSHFRWMMRPVVPRRLRRLRGPCEGKTAYDVAAAIIWALGGSALEEVGDFAGVFANLMEKRGGRRFNIVIDALDEASTPVDARAIIAEIVLPIATTCSHLGTQVLLGSRRADAAGDLLRSLGRSQTVIDLDLPEYFTLQDLSDYVLATLQLYGDERPDSPYATMITAQPVAEQIAALSGRNFLVGGLIARSHGLYDASPCPLAEITYTANVGAALDFYLSRMPPMDGDVPAVDLLTALAYAESPGLTLELWQAAVLALTDQHVPILQLARFANGPAASFLIEFGDHDTVRSYRMFHQAVNDSLLRARHRLIQNHIDEKALVRRLCAGVRGSAWHEAPRYLLRSLPGHASRGGMLNRLLRDDEYLLHADLRQSINATSGSVGPLDRDRVKLLSLTPSAAYQPTRLPEVRFFSLTEVLEGLGTSYRKRADGSFTAIWATTSPRAEYLVIEDCAKPVTAICTLRAGGRTLLASASGNAVWISDPVSGELVQLLETLGQVRVICPLNIDGRLFVASGGYRGVQIWDAISGRLIRTLEQPGNVDALCSVVSSRRTVLAAAGESSVWLSDPLTGELLHVLPGGLRESVYIDDKVYLRNSLCVVESTDGILLATAGRDSKVRIWDPGTGDLIHLLEGHCRPVDELCSIPTPDGYGALASAGIDGTIRVWNLDTGQLLQVLEGHTD